MSEVVVLVPSRSRPESLQKAWESVRDTSQASLLAYVDNDQAGLYEHLPAVHLAITKPGSNRFEGRLEKSRFTIVTGPRFGPISAINTLCHNVREGGLQHLYPGANIFTYLTDDSTIGPPGWDQYLSKTISTFPNEIGVVSLAHADADYVNFYAISAAMVNAVGYYAIPQVNHAWYWDTAMELVGDATRMVYAKASDVSVDHAPQVTLDSQGLPAEDCRQFAHWCISGRKRIIQSVREKMRVAL